jgi:hypothetical protein
MFVPYPLNAVNPYRDLLRQLPKGAITEIARRAGVSRTAASQRLNGHYKVGGEKTDLVIVEAHRFVRERNARLAGQLTSAAA